jgi:hypothetical protein
MHSPKFPTKAADLKKIVATDNLRAIWKKKVREHLRKQLIPDPVEFLDFHVNLKQRTFELESLICTGEYQPRPIIRVRSEKSKGLCRQLVLPSPEDALILQALSDALWKVIEPKAPSTNAFYAAEDQAFSKKNPIDDDDEWGYGPIQSWLDFQKTILGFSQIRRYVVVTDIANYYDSVLHTYLRAILSDYAHEREHSLDLLLFVLDSMLWRPDYMPNYGIGLPQMSLDAPRLLAHTHLFEVDAIFSKDKDVDFARYMDDMDFGVDNIAKAKTVLRDLDLALQTRNLRLNSGKTKILTREKAYVHFRIADNSHLNEVEKKIVLLSAERRPLFGKTLSRLLDKKLHSGYFDDGNGDKIIKRCLRIIFSLGAETQETTFRYILYNKPGLRDTLLKYWCRCSDPRNRLSILSGYLRSGEAVDEVSKILIATSIVNARFELPIQPADLDFLLDSFERTKPFDLFCRLWLISRFSTAVRLKSEIDSTNLIWSRHQFLSRTVAGFYGLFKATAHFAAFEAFTRKWGGPEASALLDFHDQVSGTKGIYLGVKVFADAVNPTSPNRITHPKSLVLASMLNNPVILKKDRASVLGTHHKMMADAHYRSQFSDIISSVV